MDTARIPKGHYFEISATPITASLTPMSSGLARPVFYWRHIELQPDEITTVFLLAYRADSKLVYERGAVLAIIEGRAVKRVARRNRQTDLGDSGRIALLAL